jgi:RNA polymerase-binding transcription factor DksA
MKGFEALHNPGEIASEEERADWETQFHTNLALLRHQQRIEPITRLASSGVCDDCGNTIPPERIAAMPHCIRCIGCQQAFELRERI